MQEIYLFFLVFSICESVSWWILCFSRKEKTLSLKMFLSSESVCGCLRPLHLWGVGQKDSVWCNGNSPSERANFLSPGLPGEGSSFQKRVCRKMYSSVNKMVWKDPLIFAGSKLRYSLTLLVSWSLAIIIVQSSVHLRNSVCLLLSFSIDFSLMFREACTLCDPTLT